MWFQHKTYDNVASLVAEQIDEIIESNHGVINSGYLTKQLLRTSIDIERLLCRTDSNFGISRDLDASKLSTLNLMYVFTIQNDITAKTS